MQTCAFRLWGVSALVLKSSCELGPWRRVRSSSGPNAFLKSQPCSQTAGTKNIWLIVNWTTTVQLNGTDLCLDLSGTCSYIPSTFYHLPCDSALLSGTDTDHGHKPPRAGKLPTDKWPPWPHARPTRRPLRARTGSGTKDASASVLPTPIASTTGTARAKSFRSGSVTPA